MNGGIDRTQWLLAVVWFLVLVGAPVLVQAALVPVLRRHRSDPAAGKQMRLDFWRLADADPRNYSAPGRKYLALFKTLQVLQMFGFVVWCFVFVF